MSIKSVSLVNGNDRKVLSNIKQLVPIITVSNKITIKWHIYETNILKDIFENTKFSLHKSFSCILLHFIILIYFYIVIY